MCVNDCTSLVLVATCPVQWVTLCVPHFSLPSSLPQFSPSPPPSSLSHIPHPSLPPHLSGMYSFLILDLLTSSQLTVLPPPPPPPPPTSSPLLPHLPPPPPPSSPHLLLLLQLSRNELLTDATSSQLTPHPILQPLPILTLTPSHIPRSLPSPTHTSPPHTHLSGMSSLLMLGLLTSSRYL